jgi:hypothetical protein
MVLSARLSIVETALEEIMTRLGDVPSSDRATELGARAERLDRVLDAWLLEEPSEDRRREIVSEVLDLAVEVTRFHLEETGGGRRSGTVVAAAPHRAVSDAVPAESLWRETRAGATPPASARAPTERRAPRGREPARAGEVKRRRGRTG